jgi:tRNA threonylcarbamoyladenosine biosynthesis protein TsaB
VVPTILALDTSTAELSVAVAWPGGVVSRQVAAGRRTGALLAPAVQQVMAVAGRAPRDLDAVAVGVGPGPYTSLRAGIMFAKAVGFAMGVPVVGACSLDILARELAGDVLVALDARRREVYWARYDAAGQRVVGPLVGPPAAVAAANDDVPWWGPGHPVGADEGRGASPDAAVLAAWAAAEWPLPESAAVVGEWDGARGDGGAVARIPQTWLRPEPMYLRRPDASEPTAAVQA